MTKHLMIRELPLREQPRERSKAGMAGLSNAELLQLITRTPYAHACAELLAQAGSLTALSAMTDEEMTAIYGMGVTGAKAIQAALELARRMAREEHDEKTPIRSPAAMARLFSAEFGNSEQEHIYVMLLDVKLHVIELYELYRGCVDGLRVRHCELFKRAIARGADCIVIAHNHPSGNPTPSNADIETTKKIVAVGDVVGIEVLDHIIVAGQRWVSLKTRRLGFS